MMFSGSKEGTLKISLIYLKRDCVQKGGVSRRGVLGGHSGFLHRDRDGRVIHDIMNDVQERRYLEDIKGS